MGARGGCGGDGRGGGPGGNGGDGGGPGGGKITSTCAGRGGDDAAAVSVVLRLSEVSSSALHHPTETQQPSEEQKAEPTWEVETETLLTACVRFRSTAPPGVTALLRASSAAATADGCDTGRTTSQTTVADGCVVTMKDSGRTPAVASAACSGLAAAVVALMMAADTAAARVPAPAEAPTDTVKGTWTPPTVATPLSAAERLALRSRRRRPVAAAPCGGGSGGGEGAATPPVVMNGVPRVIWSSVTFSDCVSPFLKASAIGGNSGGVTPTSCTAEETFTSVTRTCGGSVACSAAFGTALEIVDVRSWVSICFGSRLVTESEVNTWVTGCRTTRGERD